MPLRFHNTLTRRVEEFRPANPPRVTVYACGPTVYGPAHIGNWSSFLFFDVVVRWLRLRGYQVRFVTNVTDVEDKTIRDSRAAGETLSAFTRRWEADYLEGRRLFGCVVADAFPRATEHVDGMRDMIQALLDRGHAYVAEDGIYFRVASFPTYGELANLSAESLRAGASGRVRADEYEKEHVSDFVLWKAWDPAADGDVAWTPTFTVDGQPRTMKGRPGWHIECSVMIRALLGDQIDLHLGGEDLKFPHHQNELAQSEAATGKQPFVRHWMHRRHLLVDGAKMSKSKKNFYTVQDLVARAGPSGPRAFRYLVATAHYGTPIDFTWAGLEAAAATLRNLADARVRLAKAAGAAAPAKAGAVAQARAAFEARMDDDLDTPGAMAAVQEWLHEANKALAAGTLPAADAAAGVALLDEADEALGLALRPTRTLSADEQALVDARMAARRAKQWGEADRLRAELASRGVLVKDSKDGQEISFS
ncbi:MAG: cysteine--tRNA ligase [Planctomycetes bacterium]|nr:cysteine--tRNA ligase [Planctomycetota bacterium]